MEKIFSGPIASFTDLLLDAVCMVDVSGRFVFVSAACERIFGYTQEEMIGKVMIDLVAPDDRERTLARARAIMDGEPCARFENRYVRKDGSLVDIMWSARWSEADQLRIAVARDITAVKQADAMQAALYAISEAAHTTQDLPTLFAHIHRIVGTLLPASCLAISLRDEAAQRLNFAYYADESGPVAHHPLANVLSEEVWACGRPLAMGSNWLGELPSALQIKMDPPHHWMGVPLSTQQGNIGTLVLQCKHDIAGYTDQDQDLLVFVSTQVATAIQRKQLNARLQFIALHDELTQLPNRRLFRDRMETAFARAERQQWRLSVLFIDLNKFKQINDQFGHASGDVLLQEVARRIKSCVRETDTVARLGGDEFVVLLEDVTEPDNTTLIEAKIHSALAAPINLNDGCTFVITATIGVAHFPEHGGSFEQLIRHADQAMYAAKKACDPTVV